MKVNPKGIVALLTLILAALGINAFYSGPSENWLNSSADAFTLSSSPSTNYGANTILQVSKGQYNRYAWVKFDLSAIPGDAIIDWAEFSLTEFETYCPDISSFPISLYIGSNSWTETSITWNNQPSVESTPLDTQNAKGYEQYTKVGFGFPGARDSGKYIQRIQQIITAGGKEITFVIKVDPSLSVPSDRTYYINFGSKENDVGYKPLLVVRWSLPSYPTLTVVVKDENGNPIKGCFITQPWLTVTPESGTVSQAMPAGTYTVKTLYNSVEKSQSVNLDSDKTVTFTYTIGTAPPTIPTYTVQYTVKDQRGHALPAVITETIQTQQQFQCDSGGRLTRQYTIATSFQVTIKATIQVGAKTYDQTESFTVSGDLSKAITITRRFFWVFHVDYTDGTKATGTLTLKSATETLTASVSNGYGEAYLMDTSYEVTFTASPEVKVTTVNVVNDGELFVTINKGTGTTTSTNETTIPVTSPQSPVVSPEIPWVLIPSVYIYGLLGVLGFGFIMAAVVALRRKRR